MSGCSHITRQTMAFSGAEQKFAFLGQAHIYLFDMKESAYRIDSILPYCEKLNAEEAPVKEEILAMHDRFGGVGVSCLDFSTQNPKLLAACTIHSQLLEVWDTSLSQLIKTFKIGDGVLSVQWAPTNIKTLVCLCRNRAVKIVNVESGTIDTLNLDPDVTVAWWHPRQASKLLVGRQNGYLYLYNIEKRTKEITYDAMSNSNGVVELMWNPGEDVFLALFKDGTLRLYAQDEKSHKMEFEKQ